MLPKDQRPRIFLNHVPLFYFIDPNNHWTLSDLLRKVRPWAILVSGTHAAHGYQKGIAPATQ
jgi:hypothetical protein